MECSKCKKQIAEADVASRGNGYVRCRPCTRKMLAGCTVAGTLDLDTGKLSKPPSTEQIPERKL